MVLWYNSIFRNRLTDSVAYIFHEDSPHKVKFSRLMSLLFRTVERLGDDTSELKEQNITCLNRMVGLLMSLSYENGMLIAVVFFLFNCILIAFIPVSVLKLLSYRIMLHETRSDERFPLTLRIVLYLFGAKVCSQGEAV